MAFGFTVLADPGRPPGEALRAWSPRPAALCCRSCQQSTAVGKFGVMGSTDAGEDRILSHACTQFVYMLHFKCTKSVSEAMVVSGTQRRSTAVPRAPSPGREIVLCPVHLFPLGCLLPPVLCDWSTAAQHPGCCCNTILVLCESRI